MDNDTVFYVLGISLTLLALAVAAIGLRAERFPPSRGALLGGIAIFVVLVGATTTFAWRNSAEEREHIREEREAGELPTPQEVAAEIAAGADAEEAEQSGAAEQEAAGEETGGAGDGADGEALFISEGCGGCHALAAAGTTAETGPPLEQSLAGANAAYIETSIVDPDAEIAQGFAPGIMPDDYGERLAPDELDALVQFLLENAAR